MLTDLQQAYLARLIGLLDKPDESLMARIEALFERWGEPQEVTPVSPVTAPARATAVPHVARLARRGRRAGNGQAERLLAILQDAHGEPLKAAELAATSGIAKLSVIARLNAPAVRQQHPELDRCAPSTWCWREVSAGAEPQANGNGTTAALGWPKPRLEPPPEVRPEQRTEVPPPEAERIARKLYAAWNVGTRQSFEDFLAWVERRGCYPAPQFIDWHSDHPGISTAVRTAS